MKKEKRNYEAPSLTVVSFKAERGYGASSGQLVEPNMTSDGYEHEDYTNGGNQTWGTF